ncbi:MAG: hypothetical protein E6I12_07915 [Chloroflexi bacterium]|nr:MAG: hypothetical protein E6I12_07915 [Chloroflexota bacterium]
MNPHANEDMMWQRLQELQREVENSRLYVGGPSLPKLIQQLGRRLLSLAGLATRRPHRRPTLEIEGR